jgi:NADP-dependent 3-hydroxy acid dehydrogenase YdfG
MPFPYKTVLVTGATSGIGRALAGRMIDAGIFVIAVGRNKSRLDEIAAKYGSKKIVVESFDVSDLDALHEWCKRQDLIPCPSSSHLVSRQLTSRTE